MISLEKVTEIVKNINNFSDADIELFVKIAVEQGLTFDTDYLRLILKDMKNS
jgi:hypothetical protein